MDGPIVYVRQLYGGLYALDRILGQVFPLDFVPPNAPVAVRPLTEGLAPEGAPISLAWGELAAADTTTARLHLSAPDGSQAVEALRETYGASDPSFQFVPWRWREDGQLYYTRQPVEGMGGLPAFVNAANLWLYDPQSGGSVGLVSNEVTGGKLCLAAISADDRQVVHHCEEGGMAILDLETGNATTVRLPDQVTSELLLGSVRFSPDGSRIAFAAMRGGYQQIEGTQGYVAVSDNLGLCPSSHVIVTREAGEWFSVAGWLSDDRLVLQSHPVGPDGWPAVWTVHADGSGLVKLAEGTFLAGFSH
jgi:tricorn protease-like protein